MAFWHTDSANVFKQLQQGLSDFGNQAPWAQKANPAQNALTNNALAGNDWLQAGDYSSKPKGQFFDFQMPQQQLEQYKKLANVGQGGTFALGANGMGGRSAATAQQGQFLQDRFARDASQNYQNNIANMGNNIQNALQQSSGANLQSQGLDLQGQSVNNAAIVDRLKLQNSMFQSDAANKPSGFMQLLQGIAQGAGAFGV